MYGSITPRWLLPGATSGDTAPSARLRASTIGRSREASSRSSPASRRSDRLRRGDVADHDREWLVHSAFTLPEASDGVVGSGIARQVEAAQPLHGDDLAAADEAAGRRDRVAAQRDAPRHPPSIPRAHTRDMRSAGRGSGGRAGSRTRCDTAAHMVERFHRRGGPVVRCRLSDGEARPAVRAVDERVPEPAITRVVQLCETFVARAQVRRDERRPMFGGVDSARSRSVASPYGRRSTPSTVRCGRAAGTLRSGGDETRRWSQPTPRLR